MVININVEFLGFQLTMDLFQNDIKTNYLLIIQIFLTQMLVRNTIFFTKIPYMNDISVGIYKQTYEAIDNPGREDKGYNFIYPWKFWLKQSFSPGHSSNLCYTH